MENENKLPPRRMDDYAMIDALKLLSRKEKIKLMKEIEAVKYSRDVMRDLEKSENLKQ